MPDETTATAERKPDSVDTHVRCKCSKCGHEGDVWIDPVPLFVARINDMVMDGLAKAGEDIDVCRRALLRANDFATASEHGIAIKTEVRKALDHVGWDSPTYPSATETPCPNGCGHPLWCHGETGPAPGMGERYLECAGTVAPRVPCVCRLPLHAKASTPPSSTPPGERRDVMWQPAGSRPSSPGWYRVRRVDNGAEKVRAFGGGGLWWTPLTDGWLSEAIDGETYEWLPRRLATMEPPESLLSPIDEMKRAAGEPAGEREP